MPLHDVVDINGKNGLTTENQGAMSSIWAKAAGTPKAVEQLQAAAVASWRRCASTPRAEQSGACSRCCVGK